MDDLEKIVGVSPADTPVNMLEKLKHADPEDLERLIERAREEDDKLIVGAAAMTAYLRSDGIDNVRYSRVAQSVFRHAPIHEDTPYLGDGEDW